MAVPFDQIDQRSWYAEIREQGGRLSLRQSAAMTLGENADLQLRRESGANVLLICRSFVSDSESGATTGSVLLPLWMAVTACLSAAVVGAKVTVLDFTYVEDGFDELIQPLMEIAPAVSVYRRRQVRAALDELRAEIEERGRLDDRRAPPRLLAIVGLHRARDFDPDDPTADGRAHPAELLETVLPKSNAGFTERARSTKNAAAAEAAPPPTSIDGTGHSCSASTRRPSRDVATTSGTAAGPPTGAT